MVGMVEQYLVQASPIKDFAAFGAPGEVFLFFRRKLFVFVECHCLGAIASRASRCRMEFLEGGIGPQRVPDRIEP